MKNLPNSNRQDYIPSLYSFRSDYFAFLNESFLFIYQIKKDQMVFLSSIALNCIHPSFLTLNDNKLCNRLISIVMSNNEVCFCDVVNDIQVSMPIIAEKAIFDPLFPSSALLIHENNHISHVTLNFFPSPIISTNWEIVLQYEAKQILFPDHDQNKIFILAKNGEIIIYKRDYPGTPFQIVSSLAYFFNVEVVQEIISISYDFILAFSQHQIHLIHVPSLTCLLIIETQNIINCVQEIAGDPFKLVVFFVDNTISVYSKINTVFEPLISDHKLKITTIPLFSNENSVIIMSNSLFFFELVIQDSIIVPNQAFSIPVRMNNTPISFYKENMILYSNQSFIDIYIQSRLIFRLASKQPSSFFWYSDTVFLYIEGGKLYRNDITENSIQRCILFNPSSSPISSVYVSPNLCVIAQSNNYLIKYNMLSNNYSIGRFSNVKAFCCGEHDHSIIIALSIDEVGIVFVDDDFVPCFGTFPQLTPLYSYVFIESQFPYVYAVDSANRLFVFDISTKGCIGSLSLSRVQSITKSGNIDSVLISCLNGIHHVNSKLESEIIIDIPGSIFVLEKKDEYIFLSNNNVYLKRNSLPIASFERMILNDSPPVFLSPEKSMEYCMSVCSVLRIASDGADESADIYCLLEQAQETPLIQCKDVKRLYHKHLLSFTSSSIPTDVLANIYCFTDQFKQAGDFFGAAVISHISKNYMNSAVCLLDSQRYELATSYIYQHKIPINPLLGVANYVNRAKKAGRVVDAILALYGFGSFHSAASLLYEQGLIENLKYLLHQHSIEHNEDDLLPLLEFPILPKEKIILDAL